MLEQNDTRGIAIGDMDGDGDLDLALPIMVIQIQYLSIK